MPSNCHEPVEPLPEVADLLQRSPQHPKSSRAGRRLGALESDGVGAAGRAGGLGAGGDATT